MRKNCLKEIAYRLQHRDVVGALYILIFAMFAISTMRILAKIWHNGGVTVVKTDTSNPIADEESEGIIDVTE